MPRIPAPDLVLVQSDLALGPLEPRLDHPALARDDDQLRQGRRRRAKLLGLDEPFALAMDATVGHGTGWGMSQESVDLLAAMFGVPPRILDDDVIMAETPSGFDRAEDDPSEQTADGLNA